MDMYQRTEILLGNLEKIKSSNVCICGIGGVGSYTLEALARIGVLNITIIDKDIIDITNINRQIIALHSTIGKDKVEVAKQRVLDINQDCNVTIVKDNITKDNINDLLDKKFDYIVDAVDNIEAKISIISFCKNNSIPIISCMGMGNKLNPLEITVSDISKSNTCPLAKLIRKKIKELNISDVKVVYSKELPKKKTLEEKEIYNSTLGSVSFVPSVAGLVIASEVVKDIIKC